MNTEHIVSWSKHFSGIPELNRAVAWVEQNPEEALAIAQSYQSLLQRIDQYEDTDIAIVKQARDELEAKGISLKSASKLRTDVFLKAAKTNNVSMANITSELFLPDSDNHQEAVSNAARMMQNGSDIARTQTEPPKDHDPVWDSVIWGHTQAKEDVLPKVLVHFMMTHYVLQFMNLALGSRYGLVAKDDLINVIGDVLLYEDARNGSACDMTRVWIASKNEGGLGWLSEDHRDICWSLVS